MIDRVQHRVARTRSRTKPHRAPAAVRTDFNHRQPRAGSASQHRGGEQRVAFIFWHETSCRERNRSQRCVKHGYAGRGASVFDLAMPPSQCALGRGVRFCVFQSHATKPNVGP